MTPGAISCQSKALYYVDFFSKCNSIAARYLGHFIPYRKANKRDKISALNSIKNANLRICKHEICYGLNSHEILPRIHGKLEVCTIKMILGKAEN